MMALPDLGKQVGPLPLGAWIAVVGAGLGIAYYTRKSGTNEEPVVVDDTSGDPGVGQGAGGWQYVDPSSGGQTQTTKEIETNVEWGRTVVNYLIAQGYNASVADAMVRKALVGQALNAQENALYIIALQAIGAMPEPLPPTPNDGATTPPDGTAQPAYVGPARKKAWKTDSYARPALSNYEQVLLYYYDNVAPAGPTRRVQMLKLEQANRATSDRFTPGSRVFLPGTL